MNKLDEKIPIKLGDKRLDQRYETIVEKSLKQPSQSIPSTFKDWHQTKAVYRFFSNSKVTEKKIIDHQNNQTLSHIKQVEEKDILVLQDTTNLNYQGHKNKQELFQIHTYVKKGLNIHASIAVTPHKINLGLLKADIWTGEEEKRSKRWVESFAMTQKIAHKNPEKNFFNVCDREGDMYDIFLESIKEKTPNLYFIIRSSANRCTTTAEGKLRETIDKASKIGSIAFEHQKDGKKRLVKQAIKAQEEKPPKGEQSIEWIILTNHPVKSLEDAKKKS